MIKEYIIGREGNQNFKIDDEKNDAVSRRHARLTINEETGEWRLRDEQSANGTYIFDNRGELIPVTEEIIIKPTTRISFGGLRYNALTVVAHIVDDGAKKGFADDFNELEQQLAEQKRREKKRTEMLWFRRIALSLLPVAFLLIPGIGMMGRIVGVTVASVFNAVLSGFDKTNKFTEERQRTIVCPQCGSQLSDKDVEKHYCSRCKAH